MTPEWIVTLLRITTLAALGWACVYVVGIVWRVEEKFDVAYKLFSVALLALLGAEIINLFYYEARWIWVVAEQALRALFAVCLLLGVWWMRDLVRDIDGEK